MLSSAVLTGEAEESSMLALFNSIMVGCSFCVGVLVS
jgi:hypothetical protein